MKQINVYMDIQSLHNYAIRALGNFGSNFMNKPNPSLNLQTPTSFYTNNPTSENYKKILSLIESMCSLYN